MGNERKWGKGKEGGRREGGLGEEEQGGKHALTLTPTHTTFTLSTKH